MFGLTPEILNNIGKPKHYLYYDLERSMIKMIKMRKNDVLGCDTAKVMCNSMYTKFQLESIGGNRKGTVGT